MIFTSTHKLDFEVAPYEQWVDDGYKWLKFRVGTCDGLWCVTKDHYRILSIDNKELNNGHFKDVMEWFEHSCRRDNKSLVFMALMNPRFEKHLIDKLGFKPFGEEDLIKTFEK